MFMLAPSLHGMKFVIMQNSFKKVQHKSKKASQLTGFFIALLIFRRISMVVCCLRVLRARFEAPGLPAQPALNPPTATSRTDLVWKSSSLCNHTTHVLIQVAKILNLPCVRRYFYAIFSQSFWNQVAIRTKYD